MQRAIIYYDPPGNTSHEKLLFAAADYTGENTGNWEIAVTPRGKPYFPDHPQVHFSISHSGGHWGCAFSEGNVGFDLQEIRKADTEKIAKRFFSTGENAAIAAAENPELAFFEIWTAKESYVKFTGLGLSSGMGSFDVTLSILGAVITPVQCPAGFAAALCTETDCEIQYK